MKKEKLLAILALTVCSLLLASAGQVGAVPSADAPPEVLRAIATGSRIPVETEKRHPAPKPKRTRIPIADRDSALAGLSGRIAFMSDRDGDWEIFVMNADGSLSPAQLTHNASNDYTPQWSPDGNKIAFTSDRTGNLDVYVMSASGSGQVNRSNYPFADEALPDWSPDGSHIAFCSDRSGYYNIYVMDADGSNVQQLTYLFTHAMAPTWSPDGSKIAFTVYVGYDIWWGEIWDIYIIDADGENLVRLTENALMNLYPDYSSDGQQITFSSTRAGDNDVFLMNSDGSQQYNLTYDSIYQEWYSAWSPDGTKLAYTFDDDLTGLAFEGDDVYIMNPDGTQRVNLTNDPTSHNRAPSWIGGGQMYSISGHVRDGGGNPIPAVVISAGIGGSTTTDANGHYTLDGVSPGTYTLTPSKNGYTFSPATRTVTVPPDATGQDFTGSTPLRVIATTPTGGAVEVSRATPITATFNISVDSATLNEDTVLVSDGSFNLLGTVIYDDQTRTVRFVVNRFTFLRPGKVYTVTLTDEIAAADSYTNTLRTHQWNFITAAYSLDSDGDGLTDMVEYDGWKVGKKQYTSNPFHPDTDGDLLNDSVEKQGRTDPRNDDTDGDELKDAEEDKNKDARVDFGETDPRLWDTDGDGLEDGDDPVPYIVTNRKALLIWLMEYPEKLRRSHPGLVNLSPSDYEGIGDLRWNLKYLGFDVAYKYDVPDGYYFFTYDQVSSWIQEFADDLNPDDVAAVVIHTHGGIEDEEYLIAYGDGIYSEDQVTAQLKQLDSRLDFLWLLTCHSWAYKDGLSELDTGGIVFFGSDGKTGARPAIAGFYRGIAGAEWDESEHWTHHYSETKALGIVEAVIPTINAVAPEQYRVWKCRDDYAGDMDLLSPWLSPQAAVIAQTTLAGILSPNTAMTPTASFSETTYTTFDSNDDGHTDAITICWSVETTVAEEEVFVSAVVYDSSSSSLEAYIHGPYTVHSGSADTNTLEFYAAASDIYRVSLDLYSLPAALSDLARLEDISLHHGPGPQDGHEAFTSVVSTDGSHVGAGEVITVTWSASTTLASEEVTVFASLGTNPESGTVLEIKEDGPYTIYRSSPNTQVTTLTLPGSGVYYVDLCLIDSSFRMEDCTELKLWATGVYSDTGVDTNSNGLYDSLAIDAGLNVPQDGNYALSGSIYDETGKYIASASESGHFSVGSSTARLQFDGETIRKSRRNGPYVLRDLKLLSDDGSSDTIRTAYTTSAYQYTQFELPTAMFNGRFDDIGEDTDGDALWDTLSVSVGVDLAAPGSYEASGYLSDSSGNQLDYRAISQTLEVGSYTVTLDFDGLAVAESGADGPYFLEQLTLRAGDGKVLDRMEEAYSTQPYSHAWFQPSPAIFSGSFSDHGTDLDGDGLYEFLTIDIGLTITDTGLYRLEGLLADSEGEGIRWASVTDLFDQGQQTVQLNFDGQAIRENRVSGAFDLVQINLIDYYTETWRYLSQQSDAYATQSYSYLDFGEREHLFLPLVLRSR